MTPREKLQMLHELQHTAAVLAEEILADQVACAHDRTTLAYIAGCEYNLATCRLCGYAFLTR